MNVRNFDLAHIPNREEKPRSKGITMVMDKGLSLREAEQLLETSADLADIIKLGWATSYVYPRLEEKIKLYKEAGVDVYFGGTLFEIFVIRGQFEDYRKLLDKYDLNYAEVSDGSMFLEHEEKCRYISTLASQVKVLSEVGSKDANNIIPPYKWIELIKSELNAGAERVIGEAREAGNVGLFQSSGEVRSGLIDEILTEIEPNKMIWEAPQKVQQVFFVKLLGSSVNLGNIAPSELIPLETLRLGIRSDTFYRFLPDSLKS